MAKFKKILSVAFRATLNFGNIRWLRHLQNLLTVFLAGHTVAMVTYYVMERTTTCSPIVGLCFDAMIVASSD